MTSLRATAFLAMFGQVAVACSDADAIVKLPPEPVRNPCENVATKVYVIELDFTFSRFDPATRRFEFLGQINCPSANLDARPFSMTVDRYAVAWVLYNTGEMFRFDVDKPWKCRKAKWVENAGIDVFGMGYSSEADVDTLYISGGQFEQTVDTSSATLMAVDTTALTARPVGHIRGWPELTGTSNGQLWGFFPSARLPVISRIDRTTAALERTYELPELAGAPQAWAFAFWGGDFWVFLTKDDETSTTAYQVDGETGALKGQTVTEGMAVIGAGVSTCAPLVSESH